jgi:hypothetical protein
MPKPLPIGKFDFLLASGLQAAPARQWLSTGTPALDDQLCGGLPGGAVTEIFGETSPGPWWLALRVLAQVKNKVCALVEPAGTFFPPGAAWLGVDLRRLLVVRETNRKKALWALDRIARQKNVAACLAAIPHLADTELRRLQLAAEDSGQAVILLRQPAELSRASWGVLRLVVRAQPGLTPGRRVVVEVLRMRGAPIPRPMLLELDDDSMAVRTSAVLPHRADHTRFVQDAG